MNYPPALSPRDSAATRPFSDGVPAGTVHELRAPEATAGHLAWAARLLAPGTGPVLWASHAAYPPGIAWAGLDPARCLFAEARDDAEALATLELALRGGMAGVAESATCPRLAARRLALAARQGGSVGFLLRHATRRTAQDSTAFASRWLVTPAPGGRLLAELLYAQGAQPASFLMDMETEHGPTPPAVIMAPERRRAG
jgi:protein ImuA